MQMNNLKKNTANRKSRKVGRGGARGKTSGRGTKGQNARAGRKKRPEMRDFIKKIPKLRGRGRNFLKTRKPEYFTVNLSSIDQAFSVNDVVSAKTLKEKGLLKLTSGVMPKVKVLNGTISKAFTFEGVAVSESAKKAIESAKGKIV